MISFSFSSGSAVLADFTINNRGSGFVSWFILYMAKANLGVRAERLLETTSGFVSCLLCYNKQLNFHCFPN